MGMTGFDMIVDSWNEKQININYLEKQKCV